MGNRKYKNSTSTDYLLTAIYYKPMDQVEEIKSRLDTSEVIGSYIQLKPAGANHKGVCPFHHEKTPSFMVSDEKGIWHCFGCGEGGDIFTFVEKMEGLDFRGALENLARRAGITLVESGAGAANAKQKERLYEILEAATKYFQTALVKSPVAQNYIIKQRGFNKAAVEGFRLGYAPTTSGLVDFLRKHKYSAADVTKAGLGRQRGGQLQDLFRGRFMVPFADSLGRIIGFTGRVLDADSMPKYMNSPQTLLFDKSRYVFGLFQAKTAIRTNKESVVVEGNLDVISAHQFGSTNVVAASGTALTQWQLKALGRLAPVVKLAFDQDAAGLAATERAIPIAQTAGVALHIVTMPGAKDPDELIRRDPKAWQSALGSAVYVMDWLLDALSKQYEVNSGSGKKQIAERFINILKRLSDPVEQDHYAQKLAQLVAVEPGAIRRKLEQQGTATAKAKLPKKTPPTAPQQRSDSHVVEEALLSLALIYPDTRVALKELAADDFTSPNALRLKQHLVGTTDEIKADALPKPLQSIANYVKILLLQGEEQYRNWAGLDRRIEAFNLAQRLSSLHLKKTKQNIQSEIAAAESAGNEKRRQQLLEQFRNLNI